MPETTDDDERVGTVQVSVDAASLSSIVTLLMVLAETPSTPQPMAEEARRRLVELQDQIPVQPHQWEAGARGHGIAAVQIEGTLATAAASLLDLLSGMPSTPPTVAEEAGRHAATLWSLSEEADEDRDDARPDG
jgi:hypothetical protein